MKIFSRFHFVNIAILISWLLFVTSCSFLLSPLGVELVEDSAEEVIELEEESKIRK